MVATGIGSCSSGFRRLETSFERLEAGGKLPPERRSALIVKLSNLDAASIENVEQTGIDAHLARVFSEGRPMSGAAAGWTKMDANRSVTPYITDCLARNAYLIRREICEAPSQPATKRGGLAARTARCHNDSFHKRSPRFEGRVGRVCNW